LVIKEETAEAQERAKERRREMLHRIGNLTLLTKKLNPAVSNGPWAKKQKAILKPSALNLNRPLSEIELWNEDLIEQRSKKLFAEADQIIKKADSLLARKFYRDAVQQYRQAVAINPRDHVVQNKLGIAFQLLQDLNMAKKQYELAKKVNPSIRKPGTIWEPSITPPKVTRRPSKVTRRHWS
jgi:tetratricopeptide (TPR) repeat protein